MYLLQHRLVIFLLMCGIVSVLAFSSCSSTPKNPVAPAVVTSSSATVLPLPASTLTTISPLPAVSPSTPTPAKQYSYKIINAYPHDPGAFTEGLVIDNGNLFEGTGRLGESFLRRVDLETGKILQDYQLPEQYWGEGITVFKDTLIQLTWQNNTGFVYAKNSFALLRQFTYPTEGWGITSDGERLIISDGASRLYFRDPVTHELTGDIQVLDNRAPVKGINELEYINGYVYANIWPGDRIAIIEPRTGQLSGWLDLTGLLRNRGSHTRVDVLNGIAYDSQTGRLFVTGKWWPYLFEIQQVEKDH
jgi:glutaminyl-peptide cyclotransferase